MKKLYAVLLLSFVALCPSILAKNDANADDRPMYMAQLPTLKV